MTPPRRRDSSNSDLEGTNIKCVKGYYYYYVMPDGQREPLVHGDRAASKEAAIALNNALRKSGNVVNRILEKPKQPSSKNPLMTDAIKRFKEDCIPKKTWKRSYKDEHIRRLDKWAEYFVNTRTGDVDTFALSEFLKQFTNEAARLNLVLFKHFWPFVASSGYATQKPLIDIQPIKQQKRKRQRHTWEGWQLIYNNAEEWLQRAMDAALYSLQRRSDLVVINMKEDIDMQAGTIRVLQEKTETYNEPVLIDIKMGDELLNTVKRSMKTGIPCPYLIHRRPKRINRRHQQNKLHPFSVENDYLTRAFSEVRDRIGVYDHIEVKEHRPGLHSGRALGIFMYHKAGYPDEYIMALSGHATKEMIERYKEGHEKRQPMLVNADLNLKNVDMSSIDWEADISPALKSLIDADEDNF